MSRIIVALFALLLLAGCTKPVYNVQDASVVSGSGSQLSQAEVRDAIASAAISKGWAVKDIDSNHLLATHTARKHMAQVVIEYSTSSFSITYKDSRALKYDGTSIHHNYNRWIRNLELRIKERLFALGQVS